MYKLNILTLNETSINSYKYTSKYLPTYLVYRFILSWVIEASLLQYKFKTKKIIETLILTMLSLFSCENIRRHY